MPLNCPRPMLTRKVTENRARVPQRASEHQLATASSPPLDSGRNFPRFQIPLPRPPFTPIIPRRKCGLLSIVHLSVSIENCA